jgi:curved DNA-binding protein CbpA
MTIQRLIIEELNRQFIQLVESMSDIEARDHLELQPGHSEDDLKAAYREASKKHHPDVGGSPEKMKHINAAYEKLKGRSDDESNSPLDSPNHPLFKQGHSVMHMWRHSPADQDKYLKQHDQHVQRLEQEYNEKEKQRVNTGNREFDLFTNFSIDHARRKLHDLKRINAGMRSWKPSAKL